MLLLILLNPFFNFFFSGSFGRFIGFQGTKFLSIWCLLNNIIIIFYSFWFLLNNSIIQLIFLGNWIFSNNFVVNWNFNIEPLTIIMLLVVNSISFLVHLFSTKYMENDAHLIRFMSYISLFTFFMLILIFGDNLFILFFGWEGVGLCSYLLISFWYTRIQANKSALKAVIVNRISDFGLTLGIIVIFYFALTIEFTNSIALLNFLTQYMIFLNNTTINCYILTIISLLLFVGAVGKSAQIFLHTWLPDAMEGPTPVSALIHAATMVTAGVYLIIKCSNIIENSYISLNIIAFFGAVTAFFAASSGLFLSDIKKIIAYSTCSQLGYMVFACGISAYNVSLFHLMNHAVFKALLFLGAGAIIHSVSNEQDMRRMGNLIKILPMTYCTFLIATLAIIGFPFLTGFFSKDIIIENTFGFYSTKSLIMHFFALITAFFTAIYSFKVLYFIFFIKTNLLKIYVKNLHESEIAMSLPLILLALGSIFVGFIFKDIVIGTGLNFFQTGLTIKITKLIETEFITVLSKLFPLIATCFGGILLILYFTIYKKNNFFYISFIYKKLFFFINKWNFDRVYNFFINFKIMIFAFRNIYKNLDKGILEKFGPFGISQIIKKIANKLNSLQTGRLEIYLQFMILFPLIFSLLLLNDFYPFEIYNINTFLIFPIIPTITANLKKKTQNLMFEFSVIFILFNIILITIFQVLKKKIYIWKFNNNNKQFVKYLQIHIILFKIIKFKNWIKWNQQIKSLEKTQLNVNYKLHKNSFFWNSKIYEIFGTTTTIEETKIFSQIWDLQDIKYETEIKLRKQFKINTKFKIYIHTIKYKIINYIQKYYKIYEIPPFKWHVFILFKIFLRTNRKIYNKILRKEIQTLANDVYNFLIIYHFIRKNKIYHNILIRKVLQKLQKNFINYCKMYFVQIFIIKKNLNTNLHKFVIFFLSKINKFWVINKFILFDKAIKKKILKKKNENIYIKKSNNNEQNLIWINTLQKENKYLKGLSQIISCKKKNGQKYCYNIKTPILFNSSFTTYPQLFENLWISFMYKSKNLIKLNKKFKIFKQIYKIKNPKQKFFKFTKYQFKNLKFFKLNKYKIVFNRFQIKNFKTQKNKINIQIKNKQQNINTYKVSNTSWFNSIIFENYNHQYLSKKFKKIFKNLNFFNKIDIQMYQIQNLYWKNFMWLKFITKNKNELNLIVKNLRKIRLNMLLKNQTSKLQIGNAFYPNLLKLSKKKERSLFSFLLFYYMISMYNRFFWKYGAVYKHEKQKKKASQIHTFFCKRWLLICWITLSMALWNPFWNKKPIIWAQKKKIYLKKEPEFENEQKLTEFIKIFNGQNEKNIKIFSNETSYELFLSYNFIEYFQYFWPKTYKIFEFTSFIFFCFFFGIFLFMFFFISYTKIGQFLIFEWNIISFLLQNSIFEIFIANSINIQQKYTYITYFINLFLIIFFNILLLWYIKKCIKNFVIKQNKIKCKFPLDFTLNLTKLLNLLISMVLLMLTYVFWLHIISIYFQFLYFNFNPAYRWFFPYHSHNYPQNFFWYNQNILTFFEFFQGSDITSQKWRNQYFEHWRQHLERGFQKKQGESIFVYQKWQYKNKKKNFIFKFLKKYILTPLHKYFFVSVQKDLKNIGRKFNSNIYNFGKIYKKNGKKITLKRKKNFGGFYYSFFVKPYILPRKRKFTIDELENFPCKLRKSKYYLHWEYEYGVPWITKKQIINELKENDDVKTAWSDEDEEWGESLSWNDQGVFNPEKYTEWDNSIIIPYKTIPTFKNSEKNNYDLYIKFLKSNNLFNVKEWDIKQMLLRDSEKEIDEFLELNEKFIFDYFSKKTKKKNKNLFFKRIWKFEKKNIIEPKLKTKQNYNKNLKKFQKYFKIKPHIISINCYHYFRNSADALIDRRLYNEKFVGKNIMTNFLTFNQNELRNEILDILYDLLIDLRMELWEKKTTTNPVIIKYPLLENNVKHKTLKNIKKYEIEEWSADIFLKGYYEKVLRHDLWERTLNFDPINHYPIKWTSYKKICNHIFYLENTFLKVKEKHWEKWDEKDIDLYTAKFNTKVKTTKIVAGMPFLSKDFIQNTSSKLSKIYYSKNIIYWTNNKLNTIFQIWPSFKQRLYEFYIFCDKSVPLIKWHYYKKTEHFRKRLKRQRTFSIHKTKILNLNVFFNNYNLNNKINLKYAKTPSSIKTQFLQILNDLKIFKNIYIHKIFFFIFFLGIFTIYFKMFYKICQIKYKWIEQKKLQLILHLFIPTIFMDFWITHIIKTYKMLRIKQKNILKLNNIFLTYIYQLKIKIFKKIDWTYLQNWKIFINIMNFFINKKFKQTKIIINLNNIKPDFCLKINYLKIWHIELKKKNYQKLLPKNLNFSNKKFQKLTYKEILNLYNCYKNTYKFKK